jgi:hypothetical protein
VIYAACEENMARNQNMFQDQASTSTSPTSLSSRKVMILGKKAGLKWRITKCQVQVPTSTKMLSSSMDRSRNPATALGLDYRILLRRKGAIT